MTEPASTDPGTDPGTPAPAAFTPPQSQADLDRIIADRLSRQKAQFAKQYEGFDDLKSKAAEYDKQLEDRKSAEQKAREAAEAADKRAADATARAVRAEVKAIATGEFADPSDAYLYLGDLSRFIAKNGDIDSEAIETALKDIEKAKPHLVARARTDVGLGVRGGSSGSDMNSLLRQAAGR